MTLTIIVHYYYNIISHLLIIIIHYIFFGWFGCGMYYNVFVCEVFFGVSVWRLTVFFFKCSFTCLKKNQNTPRPSSEHPPVMGEKMSKCLGGIKGCKYKTSSWHLNRFLDADNIGSTV